MKKILNTKTFSVSPHPTPPHPTLSGLAPDLGGVSPIYGGGGSDKKKFSRKERWFLEKFREATEVRVINNIKIPKFLLINLIKYKKQNFNFKEALTIIPKNYSLLFSLFYILTGRIFPYSRRDKKKDQDLIKKKFLYYLNINKYFTPQSQFDNPLYVPIRMDSGDVFYFSGIFKNKKKIENLKVKKKNFSYIFINNLFKSIKSDIWYLKSFQKIHRTRFLISKNQRGKGKNPRERETAKNQPPSFNLPLKGRTHTNNRRFKLNFFFSKSTDKNNPRTNKINFFKLFKFKFFNSYFKHKSALKQKFFFEYFYSIPQPPSRPAPTYWIFFRLPDWFKFKFNFLVNKFSNSFLWSSHKKMTASGTTLTLNVNKKRNKIILKKSKSKHIKNLIFWIYNKLEFFNKLFFYKNKNKKNPSFLPLHTNPIKKGFYTNKKLQNNIHNQKKNKRSSNFNSYFWIKKWENQMLSFFNRKKKKVSIISISLPSPLYQPLAPARRTPDFKRYLASGHKGKKNKKNFNLITDYVSDSYLYLNNYFLPFLFFNLSATPPLFLFNKHAHEHAQVTREQINHLSPKNSLLLPRKNYILLLNLITKILKLIKIKKSETSKPLPPFVEKLVSSLSSSVDVPSFNPKIVNETVIVRGKNKKFNLNVSKDIFEKNFFFHGGTIFKNHLSNKIKFEDKQIGNAINLTNLKNYNHELVKYNKFLTNIFKSNFQTRFSLNKYVKIVDFLDVINNKTMSNNKFNISLTAAGAPPISFAPQHLLRILKGGGEKTRKINTSKINIIDTIRASRIKIKPFFYSQHSYAEQTRLGKDLLFCNLIPFPPTVAPHGEQLMTIKLGLNKDKKIKLGGKIKLIIPTDNSTEGIKKTEKFQATKTNICLGEIFVNWFKSYIDKKKIKKYKNMNTLPPFRKKKKKYYSIPRNGSLPFTHIGAPSNLGNFPHPPIPKYAGRFTFNLERDEVFPPLNSKKKSYKVFPNKFKKGSIQKIITVITSNFKTPRYLKWNWQEINKPTLSLKVDKNPRRKKEMLDLYYEIRKFLALRREIILKLILNKKNLGYLEDKIFEYTNFTGYYLNYFLNKSLIKKPKKKKVNPRILKNRMRIKKKKKKEIKKIFKAIISLRPFWAVGKFCRLLEVCYSLKKYINYKSVTLVKFNKRKIFFLYKYILAFKLVNFFFSRDKNRKNKSIIINKKKVAFTKNSTIYLGTNLKINNPTHNQNQNNYQNKNFLNTPRIHFQNQLKIRTEKFLLPLTLPQQQTLPITKSIRLPAAPDQSKPNTTRFQHPSTATFYPALNQFVYGGNTTILNKSLGHTKKSPNYDIYKWVSNYFFVSTDLVNNKPNIKGIISQYKQTLIKKGISTPTDFATKKKVKFFYFVKIDKEIINNLKRIKNPKFKKLLIEQRIVNKEDLFKIKKDENFLKIENTFNFIFNNKVIDVKKLKSTGNPITTTLSKKQILNSTQINSMSHSRNSNSYYKFFDLSQLKNLLNYFYRPRKNSYIINNNSNPVYMHTLKGFNNYLLKFVYSLNQTAGTIKTKIRGKTKHTHRSPLSRKWLWIKSVNTPKVINYIKNLYKNKHIDLYNYSSTNNFFMLDRVFFYYTQNNSIQTKDINPLVLFNSKVKNRKNNFINSYKNEIGKRLTNLIKLPKVKTSNGESPLPLTIPLSHKLTENINFKTIMNSIIKTINNKYFNNSYNLNINHHVPRRLNLPRNKKTICYSHNPLIPYNYNFYNNNNFNNFNTAMEKIKLKKKKINQPLTSPLLNNNNSILINRILKIMSTYNLDRLGKFMVFNRFIAFNFNHNRNKLITDIYDILFFAFKSMSCLISKPVFSFKTDKIIIHLFYFLVSPVFLKSHRRVNQFKLPHLKYNRGENNNNHPLHVKKSPKLKYSNNFKSTFKHKVSSFHKKNKLDYFVDNNINKFDGKKIFKFKFKFYKNNSKFKSIRQIFKSNNKFFELIKKKIFCIILDGKINLQKQPLPQRGYNKGYFNPNPAAKFIHYKSIPQKNVRYFKNKLFTSQSQAQSKSTAWTSFVAYSKKTVRQKGVKHQIVHQNFFNILFKSKLQKVPLTFKKRNSWNNFNKKKSFFNHYKYKQNKIKFFYENLINKPLTQIYPAKFKALCFILSKFFNKPVELNLIRVHYPYSNSNILVNFFALFINKVKVLKFITNLFNNAIFKDIVKNKFISNKNFYNNNNFNNFNSNNFNYKKKDSYVNKKVNKKSIHSHLQKGVNKNSFIIPAFLNGMNIKIAGRFLKQRIFPKNNVKFYNKGVYAQGKINYNDFARFTNKNKRGSFSISINSSQSFFNKY